MFTRRAVVDKIHIRKSTNVCKTTVRIDASQTYPHSKCQPIPTELYIRYEFDAELQRSKPRQNKHRSFEKVVMSYLQRMRLDGGIVSFYTTGTPKKIDCSDADGFCAHWNTVLEAMVCFYHYRPCQEARPATFNLEQRGKWMKCGNSISRRKVTLLSKCGNVNGGNSARLMSQ